MKLITKELISRFKEIGEQSESENPQFIAKFFNPCGSQTWYASEYNPETNICYGYVTGMAYDEWGTFSIDELKSLKLPFGLAIERDMYFKEISFDELTGKNRIQELYKKTIKKQDLER